MPVPFFCDNIRRWRSNRGNDIDIIATISAHPGLHPGHCHRGQHPGLRHTLLRITAQRPRSAQSSSVRDDASNLPVQDEPRTYLRGARSHHGSLRSVESARSSGGVAHWRSHRIYKLVIYARQSTKDQVLNNREAYEQQTVRLVENGASLGWMEDDIIVFIENK